MIKIDHICFSCKMDQEDIIVSNFPNYSLSFKEEKLVNLDIKRKIMQVNQEYHNLLYLESKNHIPIEITSYESIVDRRNGIEYISDLNELYITSKEVLKSVKFFEMCGAKFSDSVREDEASGIIKGLLDRVPLKIYIRYSDNAGPWFLDGQGECCLALLVKNSVLERERVKSKFPVSEIRELNVNKQSLKIFFTWRENGEIIEFISKR